MREAVIVDAVRTPLGRGKENGALHGWHPVDLASEALRALVDRSGLDPAEVEDVIMGCVGQVGEQGVNIGRNAALAAGFPGARWSGPASTGSAARASRRCTSPRRASWRAPTTVVIAAGVESMSRVPMGTSASVGGAPFGPRMSKRYADENLYGVGGLVPQGISAEIIAERWKLSRRELDAFSLARTRRRRRRRATAGSRTRSCRST